MNVGSLQMGPLLETAARGMRGPDASDMRGSGALVTSLENEFAETRTGERMADSGVELRFWACRAWSLGAVLEEGQVWV